jgi:hypothetical protein
MGLCEEGGLSGRCERAEAKLYKLVKKLELVRGLAFDPGALVYSDAPGFIQDIRDVLDEEVTNT